MRPLPFLQPESSFAFRSQIFSCKPLILQSSPVAFRNRACLRYQRLTRILQDILQQGEPGFCKIGRTAVSTCFNPQDNFTEN